MCSWTRVLLFLAGLMGAAGVAAAAVAAHVAGGASLQTASLFLMLNAAAVFALTGAGARWSRGRAVLQVGASLLVLGALLFSGDLAARALLDMKLLGGSAPFGGTLMICGWLVCAAGGLLAREA